ncbi:hypothetical protein G6F56_014193 [Rhizopus delemar]|nr:hypothetical protein G6F56_014193 [Rhizopus delemar]
MRNAPHIAFARRRRLAAALALATAAPVWAVSAAAQAQDAAYPSKPVTILVGFPPGTATDTVARMLSERLAPRLGQQLIVENKPGAGGAIAAGGGARAPPRAAPPLC